MATIHELWMPSPHYGTSRGAYLKGAYHTTEGARKIRDLGAWFQNPGAQCSSHHGSDNYERGLFGAYVYENYSAWTQGGGNPVCLSLEQCTPSGAASSWSRDTWLSQTILIDNAAEWMHYMAEKYGLPYKWLTNSEAQDSWTKGFCEHVNGGSAWSGHHDCGSGFPNDVVIDKARAWSGGGSAPSTEEVIVAGVAYDSRGRPWEVGSWATNGQINVKIGDNPFTAVDPSQTGAKGSPGIAYDPVNDRMRIVFINSGSRMAAYTTAVSPVNWAWDELGGNFKG